MKPTYHIVSHTHWDREWYKSFEQFRSMLVAMIDDVLELLDRDRTFECFTLDGQTVILEDYLAIRPERKDELRRLVSKGRIIIGPWYILPDEFLVSAEATVRNLLIGMQSARELGGVMKVGYIPDSFGHIAMMPAILNGFGIDTALVYRGFGGEPDQKFSEYWWRSPDGTRCLMVHLFRHGYSAGYFHQETDGEVVRRFKDLKLELDARATTSHRLLMNGGDHHWPDPKIPGTLELLKRNFEGDFIHSSIPRYVEEVKKELNDISEVSGELRFGYRYAFVVNGGVYSSRMYLKQQNWRCQNLLQRYVEPLNAYATAEGMRSHMPLVRHAWKTLLQNHPHDSICGCSIDPVHRDMVTRFKAVEEIGASVAEECLNHLIPYDDRAQNDDKYLFFFNPSPFSRKGVAEARLSFFLQDVVVGLNPDVKIAPKLPPVSGFRLVDAQGNEVPYQILARGEGYDLAYSHYNYPRQTYAETFSLLVDAADVPPVGFKGLKVERAQGFPAYESSLKTGRNFIENAYLRVEVNARGELKLKDKIHRETYTRLNVFEDSGDVGDEYSYAYPMKDRWICSNKGKATTTLLENGPLRAALRTKVVMAVPESASHDRRSRSKRSVRMPITTTVYLTPHSRAAEIVTTVENNARDHRLRVLFPSGVHTDRAYADSQFCVVERQQKEYDVRKFTIEHPAKVAPMQRCVTVKGNARALTLLSYGLPEYELKLDEKGTIALTLLRCVGLLAGEDLCTRPGGKAGWHNETPEAQCLGTHVFRYALLPHHPDEVELVNEESERFHLPLLAVRRKNMDSLLLEGSFLSVSSGRLTFSALKEAEDGQGIVVRVYNPAASEAEGMIHFEHSVEKAWSTRLDEHIIDAWPVENQHDVHVRLQPFGLITLKARLKQ